MNNLEKNNLSNRNILILFFGIIFIIFISFFSYGFLNHMEKKGEQGKLQLAEKEQIVNPYNEEWEEADKKNQEVHPYDIGIYDPKGYLMETDFLPTKAHFIKCEAIGKYLSDIGKYSESIEVVSAYKEGNNSYFTATLTAYPEITLSVIWYGITEEFSFSIKE